MLIIVLSTHRAGEMCIHIDFRTFDRARRRCGMSESFSLRLQGGKVFAEGEARTTFEFVHAQSARMQIVTWKSFPSSPAGNSLRRRGLAWGGMHPQDVVPTHRGVRRNTRIVANIGRTFLI